MRGWTDSAALVVIRIVLDRLAAHYGLIVSGSGRRTRAWRAPEDDDANPDNGPRTETARGSGKTE
jgi:hypothetical protein